MFCNYRYLVVDCVFCVSNFVGVSEVFDQGSACRVKGHALVYVSLEPYQNLKISKHELRISLNPSIYVKPLMKKETLI